jgi:hypothetical protein
MKDIRELDVVGVARLVIESRPYRGAEGAARAPVIGDVATIIGEWDPADLEAPVTAEMKDASGATVWVADFYRDELVLAGLNRASGESS